MSLHEVYRLAHTAECRLHISNSRPDRNLRVVVGHLMHYEALRLRIVEIEHDIGKAHRASVRSRDADHVEHTSLSKTAENEPGDAFDEDEIDMDDDEDTNASLGLTRFPTTSSRPPPLVSDDGEDDDEDAVEPVSPEEPDVSLVDRVLKRPADTDLAHNLEKVRNCPCHGQTGAPRFEKVWELPATPADKPGVTRVIAQVAT